MAVRYLTYKWTVGYLVVMLMVLLTNTVESMTGKVDLSHQRIQEIEHKLKQLNKQAVKSIEISNGEIIDCIPITKQPAFDHPMLKNHTIQMIPSSYPHDDNTDEGNASTPSDDKEQSEDIVQHWQLEGECPENTIPIKRITKEDLLQVDNIKDYGRKSYHLNISQPHQTHHPTAITMRNEHEHAITYVYDDLFHGAKATINVRKPRIQTAKEYSMSQIWVLGGEFGIDLNSVEAGWNVNPTLYHGDAKPRLFIYWTSDSYQRTGCHNLMCPGFVQVNRKIVLGGSLKFSSYNGPQFTLTVLIWKDHLTGNWWLRLNDKELIGYWPSWLVPNLKDKATMIQWGGQVVNLQQREQHTTTQMGSGHFPSEGFKKASYFRTLKVVDVANSMTDPTQLQTFTSRPTCYDVKTGHVKSWGVFFYYGGPGRNRRCP